VVVLIAAPSALERRDAMSTGAAAPPKAAPKADVRSPAILLGAAVGATDDADDELDALATPTNEKGDVCLFLYALYGAKGCLTVIRLDKRGTSSWELPGSLIFLTLMGAASMRSTHKAKRTRRLRMNDWFNNIIVVVNEY